MMKSKDVIFLATEINEVCDLEPGDRFDPKKDPKKLEKEIKKAIIGDDPEVDIYPDEDDFSDRAWNLLADLGCQAAIAKLNEEDTEEEDTEEEDEEDTEEEDEEDTEEEDTEEEDTEEEDTEEDTEDDEEDTEDDEEEELSEEDVKQAIEDVKICKKMKDINQIAEEWAIDDTLPKKVKDAKKALIDFFEGLLAEMEEEDAEEEDVEEEDVEEEEIDLEELSVKELKALCKEREIKIPGKATKKKLIKLLEEDDEDDEEDEENEEDEEDEEEDKKKKEPTKIIRKVSTNKRPIAAILTDLIKTGKYTKEELIAAAEKEGVAKISTSSYLPQFKKESYLPKYKKYLDDVVVEGKDGKLSVGKPSAPKKTNKTSKKETTNKSSKKKSSKKKK